MKKLLIGAMLCSSMMCASAHADEASKRAKIHELFVVMHIDKTMMMVMDQAADQGAKGAMSMFPNVQLTPAQQKVIDDGLKQIREITHDGLAWSKLEPGFTDVYAESYSESTVDGLLAFYRSPAGTEMLAKQPDVLAKSSAVVQAAVVQMQPRMQKAMQDMMSNPALTTVAPKK